MSIEGIIGCRVCERYGNQENVIGKIVGSNNELVSHYQGGSSSSLMLVLLTDEGYIRVRDYGKLQIIKEDLEELNKVLKPVALGKNRFEMMDLG